MYWELIVDGSLISFISCLQYQPSIVVLSIVRHCSEQNTGIISVIPKWIGLSFWIPVRCRFWI